jgi:hypothetical protein
VVDYEETHLAVSVTDQIGQLAKIVLVVNDEPKRLKGREGKKFSTSRTLNLLPASDISLDHGSVFGRTLFAMSINPQELQAILDELEKSRASRRRAWENLKEIRWVLEETAGIRLEPPASKTIDLEGRIVKDGVRKALRDRQTALADLVHAVREYRKAAEAKPLTLQGSDFARAVQELNKAIDRAEGFQF